MVRLHPEQFTRDGKRFVLLPYEEYQALEEEREQILDLIAISEVEAESAREPRIDWEQLKQELGLNLDDEAGEPLQ